MVSRIAVGDGKFCYSGSACKLHGGQWFADAQARRDAVIDGLKSAESFEDFLQLKQDLLTAEADLKALQALTPEGLKELKKSLSTAQEPAEKAKLRDQVVEVQKLLKENGQRANAYFLTEQDYDDRMDMAWNGTDANMLRLLAEDSDPEIRAALVLNRYLPAGSREFIALNGDERIQLHALAGGVSPSLLMQNGVSDSVKTAGREFWNHSQPKELFGDAATDWEEYDLDRHFAANDPATLAGLALNEEMDNADLASLVRYGDEVTQLRVLGNQVSDVSVWKDSVEYAQSDAVKVIAEAKLAADAAYEAARKRKADADEKAAAQARRNRSKPRR